MKLVIKDGRDFFYMYDTGRILIIEDYDSSVKSIQFESNEDSAYAVSIQTDSASGDKYVTVPYKLLNGDYDRVVAYFYCQDSTGNYTLQKQTFRIKEMQTPAGLVIDEDEILTWDKIKAEAEAYRDEAKASEENAKESEENAKASEIASAASEVNVKASEENTLSYKNATKTYMETTEGYKNSASTSASNASISESNAKESETNAKTSETKASTSESNAKTSETNAKQSEENVVSMKASIESSKSDMESEIAQAKTDIASAKKDATDTIASDKDSAISDIQAQQTTSVNAVVAEKVNSIEAVQAQEASSIVAVQAQEASSIVAVQAQEASSIVAVQAHENTTKGYMESAQTSASNASTSEENAKRWAELAEEKTDTSNFYTKSEVNTKFTDAEDKLKDNVTIAVDSQNSRKYIVSFYGSEVATFTIPVDKFLKSATFDSTTNNLVLVFFTENGTESTTEIPLGALVDTYTQGNGIDVSNHVVSLKIKSGESVLKVGSDGAYTDLSSYYTSSEVDTKLSGKSDTSHTHDDRYYTESEIDTKVSALNTSISSEATARSNADSTLQTNIDKKLSLTGGTMTGAITSQNVIPSANDTYNLGTSEKEFLKVYTKELLTMYLALGGTRLTDAGFHNGIFRGKNITSYYTDGSLWNRVAGTNGYDLFEDLYIGDYFTTGSATINGTTKTWYWQIAGFDTRLNVGETSVSSHHLVVVPCTSNGQGADVICSMQMYASTPFTTSYGGSLPHAKMIEGGDIATGLSAIFGTHLKTSSELICTANDTSGNGTSWSWQTCYATLLSETEVYGAPLWGVSTNGYDKGMDSRGQLPLFRLKPSLMSTRSYNLWLRSVCSASGFADVNNRGYAGDNTATNSYGIRPRFLIG